MKINLDKNVILGLNLEEDRLSRLVSVVGCTVGSWPVKYVGLPLGGNPLQTTFWDLVVSGVAKRLDGWKKAFLSKGGRLTLMGNQVKRVDWRIF